MNIIDGRKIKDEILEEVKRGVEELPFQPFFCDILVGSDPASLQYVRMKAKIAESIGIKFRTAEFPESITTEELVQEIDNLNKVPYMCGIIVQLPLPVNISVDKSKVLNAISPNLDVDCLGEYNNERFYNNTGTIIYPTALACMKLLDSINLDLKNKKIVVLGQGKLVGLPVTHLLRSQSLEVVVVNSRTENVDSILKDADVIISAVGRGKFITGSMVKEGVVIIDAGTSEENGAVVGDVDVPSLEGKASFVTPTPGGVGPVTVAMLLKNVLSVAQNRIKINQEN